MYVYTYTANDDGCSEFKRDLGIQTEWHSNYTIQFVYEGYSCLQVTVSYSKLKLSENAKLVLST